MNITGKQGRALAGNGIDRGEKRRLTPMQKKEAVAAWLFLTPNLLGFSIFVFLAVCVAFWLSFQSWDLISSPRFVGLANFRNLFQDRDFGRAMANTAFLVLGNVPLTVITAMVMALAMNQKLKGITVFRTAFYLPVVTSTVAISIVWIWLLNPEYGLINYVLRTFFQIQQPPEWLQSTVWSKPAIVMMSVWQQFSFYMIIFLAGLQSIPNHYYEAAEIEGASPWRRFIHITLPLLSPTTFLVITMKLIYSFQIFEQVYVMTQGGPAGSTETIVFYIFMNAFRWFEMGYAAAMAWILFIIVFVLTLLQFKLQNKWVHYE